MALDGEEWNEMLAALRRNLPLCLRVRRAHPLYAQALAELRQLEAAPVSERGTSSGRTYILPSSSTASTY